MMNKEYKNFNGNLTADLDLDSEKDFVNQGGSFSMDELLSDLESYGQEGGTTCLLYTSPSPRDRQKSRMPSSA